MMIRNLIGPYTGKVSDRVLSFRLTHTRNATSVSIATADRKFLARLWYRVAILGKFFRRQNAFSTRCLSLYRCLSYGILRWRFRRPGMTGTLFACRNVLRSELASHPLSPGKYHAPLKPANR